MLSILTSSVPAQQHVILNIWHSFIIRREHVQLLLLLLLPTVY